MAKDEAGAGLERFYAPLLGAALLAALALRLYGVTWGLPHIFNGDEPHVINLAVSYSSRDFNPHMFKYPTLWTYFLFVCFGIYFVLWSGFGLRRSVEQFGGLFAWKPASFFLIGRLVSVAFCCLGVGVVGRSEAVLAKRRGETEAWFPWAAAFLAISPNLIFSTQGAKAEGLMFFFAALVWRWGLEVYYEGRPRDYLLTGIFTGLALSTLFTALPVAAVLPLAHLLRWKRDAFRSPGLLCWRPAWPPLFSPLDWARPTSSWTTALSSPASGTRGGSTPWFPPTIGCFLNASQPSVFGTPAFGPSGPSPCCAGPGYWGRRSRGC